MLTIEQADVSDSFERKTHRDLELYRRDVNIGEHFGTWMLHLIVIHFHTSHALNVRIAFFFDMRTEPSLTRAYPTRWA